MRGLVVVVMFVARVFGTDGRRRRLVVSAATRRRSFLESLARLRALRVAPPDPVGGHRAGRVATAVARLCVDSDAPRAADCPSTSGFVSDCQTHHRGFFLAVRR